MHIGRSPPSSSTRRRARSAHRRRRRAESLPATVSGRRLRRTAAMRDYVSIANAYCLDVTEGRVVACKWTRLACQRHLNDLARAETEPAWPYRFDDWHASDVCDFIEKLPHIEGKWSTPTITLEPWQVWLLVSVFGWRRKHDGGRR